jgi:hypothetical protein
MKEIFFFPSSLSFFLARLEDAWLCGTCGGRRSIQDERGEETFGVLLSSSSS